MKKRTNLQQFFDAARAMMGRFEEVPSGDRVLDRLPLYAPTGVTRVEECVRGLTQQQAITVVLTDWWLGGTLTHPKWPHQRRLWTMMLEDDAMFVRRITDLPSLVAIGSVALTEGAPWTKYHYSQVETVRRLLLTVSHRSMATVFDTIVGLMDKKDAAYAVRVLRPIIPVSISPAWMWVSPRQGCGLAWATTGRPHGFHPVANRQEEAMAAAHMLEAASALEANWPAKFPPFTCDSVLAWSDFMWAYLKLNYAHLKDPGE